VSDARSEVLRRLAAALGRPGLPSSITEAQVITAEIDRSYRRASVQEGTARNTALFVERVGDYGALVTIVEPAALPAAIAACAGAGCALAAPGVDPVWLSELPEIGRDDPSKSARELDGVDVAVTACALAIADTGTLVLDHGPDQGRRAMTLVPDHHVCVVIEGQIVATVPDAVRALDPRRAQTWISGPSATSDIELDRVVGVHGPRRLDVVVVRCV